MNKSPLLQHFLFFNTNRIRVVYDKVYEVYKKNASATHPVIMNNKNNDK